MSFHRLALLPLALILTAQLLTPAPASAQAGEWGYEVADGWMGYMLKGCQVSSAAR